MSPVSQGTFSTASRHSIAGSDHDVHVRNRNASTNIVELLDDIVGRPARPLCNDEVLSGRLDRSGEHRHRPHRERGDSQSHRPPLGQLGAGGDEAHHIGGTAIRRGQPADRTRCHRVAAWSDRHRHRRCMDEPRGHAAKGNPAQQPRRRRPDNHKIRVVLCSELRQTRWDRGGLMDKNRDVEIAGQLADHLLE